MTLHAITVLGPDRPGIIAETTRHLADLGFNIEDSTMTLLRGHFAMTLIVRGGSLDPAPDLADGLVLGDELTVAVYDLPDAQADPPAGTAWVLTVHGGDRPGIVSAVVAEVSRVGGNITDLSTRLAGDLYLLVAEIDLPDGVDAAALDASVRAVAESLGVTAGLRAAETDDL